MPIASNVRRSRKLPGGRSSWRRRCSGSASAAGDRVGTFCWNHQQNLEAYWAIPCMGAVNHTLNIRLFPEQLAYMINHAEDRVIIVDDNFDSGAGRRLFRN